MGFVRMDSEEVKGGGLGNVAQKRVHRLVSGIRVNVRARRHFAWIEPCEPSALGGTREALIVSLREGVPLPPEYCSAFWSPQRLKILLLASLGLRISKTSQYVEYPPPGKHYSFGSTHYRPCLVRVTVIWN